jgi:hypothetical protein
MVMDASYAHNPIMNNSSTKSKGRLTHDSVNSTINTSSSLLAHLHSMEDEKANRSEGTDTYKDTVNVIKMPVAQSALMRGMLGNKIHRFRLTRVASLVTSGGGQMNLVTSVIPSQFAQSTALATLFSECRLISTSIEYTSTFGFGSSATTTLHSPMCSGFFQSSTTASPTVMTYDQCARLSNSKTFSSGNIPRNLRNSWITAAPRPWSLVSASATGSDPVGGVNGCWSINNLVTMSNSTTYFGYLIEAIYEFRYLSNGL